MGLLGNDRNGPAQFSFTKITDIFIGQADVTGIGVPEAHQQMNQCRFARSGCTDDGNSTSGGNLQVDVLERPGSVLTVAKADIFKRDARLGGKLDGGIGVGNLRLHVHDFKQPPPGFPGATKILIGGRQGQNRLEGGQNRQRYQGQVGAVEHSQLYQIDCQIKCRHYGQAGNQGDQRQRQAPNMTHSQLALQQCAAALLDSLEVVTIGIEDQQFRQPLQGVDDPHAQLGGAIKNVIAISITTSSPTISEELSAFLEDRKQGHEIKENTVEEYKTALGDLIYVLGDIPVATITYEDAKRFRETLRKIPKHRNKRSEYLGKSKEKLLALEIPEVDLLSASSISQKLGYIKTYFKWLVTRRVIEQNPFQDVTIKSEKVSYQKYSKEDLQTIFTSDLYRDTVYSQRTTTTASHWWLPLLALFTGARPSELIQMRMDDLREPEGILAAAVVDSDETNQQVKTKAGRRTFPVHPMLMQLGFGDYLEQVREAGHERVLPGIKVGKSKAGSSASTWWNERYRAKYLPETFKEQKKALYSFRHTYITEAVSVAKIPLERVQQMVGHERSHMGATKHYDKGLSIPDQYEEIEKIKFEGLDLAHLEGGWKRHRRL